MFFFGRVNHPVLGRNNSWWSLGEILEYLDDVLPFTAKTANLNCGVEIVYS